MTATMPFPGVTRVISGNLSIGHGIQPSVATLEVPLGTSLPRIVGPLTLSAPGFSLVLPDCRIDKVQQSAGGNLLVTILDRRWKWRFGEVSGVTNRRLPNGTIHPPSEFTPRQIAARLLRIMGEGAVAVGELPNDTRPEFRWLTQNPAAQLDQLCQALGCSVVLGLDNRVSIRRLGIGAPLPANPLKAGELVYDFPVVPDFVSVISGPRSIEAVFLLQAVGYERFGARPLKPIDDLSYRPAGGWEREWPFGGFLGVQRNDERELALEHVFRTYQIVREVGLGDDSPFVLDGRPLGFGNFQARSLAELRFFDELHALLVSPNDQTPVRPRRSEIFGRYYPGTHALFNRIGKVRFDYTFDARNALIHFSVPVVSLSDEENGVQLFKPGQLYLRCRCELLQADTGAALRYQWQRPTGQRAGAGTRYEHRFDVLPQTTAAYAEFNDLTIGHPELTGFTHNQAQIDRDLDRHARAAIDGYQVVPGESRTWVGWWRNFPLDGAIRQVSYSFGRQGWFTTVNRNAELANVPLATLPELRQLEQARQQKHQSQSLVDELSRIVGIA